MSYSFINTASLSSLLFPMEGESRWGCHGSPSTPVGRSWKLQEGRAGSSSQVDQASSFRKTTQLPNSPTPGGHQAPRVAPKPEAPILQVLLWPEPAQHRVEGLQKADGAHFAELLRQGRGWGDVDNSGTAPAGLGHPKVVMWKSQRYREA